MCLLATVICLLVRQACAQTQSTLSIQYSTGQPTLTITGAAGTIYTVQYTTNLSLPSAWTDRTLLQVQAGTTSWADPSPFPPSQRFYRAASVTPPADTNLVFIQPGTFVMGSPLDDPDAYENERPQRTVTISRGFWMGKYLVTQADYQALMSTNPSHFSSSNGYTEDLNRPVENEWWNIATNYCLLLTQREQQAGHISTNWSYRLPTEAEWEYACRAGTTTRLSYGDDIGYTSLTNYSWYIDNSSGTTQPVGQKLPNPWGLYDMNGDVGEWCQDWYSYYSGDTVTDPQGPQTGSSRVVRGGAWNVAGRACRSAYRTTYNPLNYSYYGFRVVLALNQQ